jgi:hypothetical protein
MNEKLLVSIFILYFVFTQSVCPNLPDIGARFRPAVKGGFIAVLQPAFGLARSQEIETSEQHDECQHAERKTGGNVINPDAENERQEIHQRRWDEDVFPVALKKPKRLRLRNIFGRVGLLRILPT